MKHLILGNGGAGVAAAKKLRELNPEDEITIVSNEPYPAINQRFIFLTTNGETKYSVEYYSI